MLILQNIVFPDNSISEANYEVYLRSSDKIRLFNNRLHIPPYQNIDFNTYTNFFSVKRWKDFTQINHLYLNINIHGEVVVEIVGIKKNDKIFSEEIILNVLVAQNQPRDTIEIHGFEKYDALYLKIKTLSSTAELLSASFATNSATKQDIQLGICINSFNNTAQLRKNLDCLIPLIEKYQLPIEFFIVNQGNDLCINKNDKIHIINQKNLGSSGGFVRSIMLAITQKRTHVLLIEDDVKISFEAVLRVIRFFQFLVAERHNIVVSGSVLSMNEMWLQLKRNSKILYDEVRIFGENQDIRRLDNALENTVNDCIRGISSWAFCAFSVKIIRDFGYPLPLFNESISVEFFERINREIVNINGVFVWQKPKEKNYSAIMQEYYHVRNMIISGLLSPKTKWNMIKRLAWDRFWHNIRTYNYIGARLNLYAIDHVVRGQYRENPTKIHELVIKRFHLENKFIKYSNQQFFMPLKAQKKRNLSHYRFFLTYANVLSRRKGNSHFGFLRNEQDFLDNSIVYVYNPINKETEIARLKRVKIAKLINHMAKSYFLLTKNHKEIRSDLLVFRNESSTAKSWEQLFYQL